MNFTERYQLDCTPTYWTFLLDLMSLIIIFSFWMIVGTYIQQNADTDFIRPKKLILRNIKRRRE